MTLTEWFIATLAGFACFFVEAMMDKPWYALVIPWAVSFIGAWKVTAWVEPSQEPDE